MDERILVKINDSTILNVPLKYYVEINGELKEVMKLNDNLWIIVKEDKK